MVKTALYDKLIESNAKMVDFHGFEMPLQFHHGIIKEHMHVREEVGVFDVSHMGDLLITDESGGKELQHLLTNKILGVAIGKCVYSHLIDDKGSIIDDLIVSKKSENQYFIVPNASMIDEVENWIGKNAHVDIKNLSPTLSCLAVQGPRSKEVLKTILGSDIENLKRFSATGYNFESHSFLNIDETDLTATESGLGIVSKTGYTGEEGFEVIIDNSYVVALWDKLIGYGPFNVQPIGLGARDTLRLEMGYLLSGLDFNHDRTPLETNCAWVVKWDHDFIGKNALIEQRDTGEYQKLIGFKVEGKAPARPGSSVSLLDSPHETVGSVSSGNHSPTLGIPIGMAYLNKEHSKPDISINLEHRGRKLKGVTSKTPFIKNN